MSSNFLIVDTGIFQALYESGGIAALEALFEPGLPVVGSSDFALAEPLRAAGVKTDFMFNGCRIAERTWSLVPGEQNA